MMMMMMMTLVAMHCKFRASIRQVLLLGPLRM